MKSGMKERGHYKGEKSTKQGLTSAKDTCYNLFITKDITSNHTNI